MLLYWGVPVFFALGVALLPQSWLPWGVLAFRRDWGIAQRAGAAALATVLLTVGAVLMLGVWRAWVGPVTPLAAAAGIVVVGAWRIWMSPRREELWRQGRATRAPLGLACLLTGPSEIGAWVFSRAGSWQQIGLWMVVLWLALTFQMTRGQQRLEVQPTLLDAWLPESRVRAGSAPEAWAPLLVAVSFWAFG